MVGGCVWVWVCMRVGVCVCVVYVCVCVCVEEHTHMTGESEQIFSLPSTEEIYSEEIGQEQHDVR